MSLKKLAKENRIYLNNFLENKDSRHYILLADNSAYIFNEHDAEKLISELGFDIPLFDKPDWKAVFFFSRLYPLKVSKGRAQFTKEMIKKIPCRTFRISKYRNAVCLEYL